MDPGTLLAGLQRASRSPPEIIKQVITRIQSDYSKSNNRSRAVVLDVDDSVILAQPRASKLVIPEMHQLYELLVKLGFRIFFVTARPYSPDNAQFTEKQLMVFGFGTYEKLFLMPRSFLKGTNGTSAFKYLTRRYIQDTLGAEIVLNIGDSVSDLVVLPPFSSNTREIKIIQKLDNKLTFLFEPLELSQLAIKLPYTL